MAVLLYTSTQTIVFLIRPHSYHSTADATGEESKSQSTR